MLVFSPRLTPAPGRFPIDVGYSARAVPDWRAYSARTVQIDARYSARAINTIATITAMAATK